MMNKPKVYGPYTRPDGRKHIIHYDGQSRRTQSYPRYLMEQHLGRELMELETVDHINGDYTDDRIENLQLLSINENIKKSAKEPELLTFNCPSCRKRFQCRAARYRHNQLKQGKSGPYCSRSCAGRLQS